MAKKVIDELITLITLKTSRDSDGNLKKFQDGIGSIRKGALKTGAALTGLASILGLMVSKTDRSIATQARFAKSIGVSFEQLQGLQGAAKLVGATADDVNQSLAALSKEMAPTEAGKYNSALLLLNVRLKDMKNNLRPASAVLLDISKKFQGLARQQQLDLGQRLGLTPGTIRLLQEGPEAIKDAMIQVKQTGGVVPEKAGQVAINYDKSLTKLKTTLKGLLQIIVLQLSPAIEKLIDGFENLITKHPQLTANVAKVIGAFTGLSVILRIIAFFGGPVIGFFKLLTPIIEGLVGILGLVNPEFLVLGAVIAGVIILWPKLVKWVKKFAGVVKDFARSEIQRLVNDFKKLEKIFSRVKGFFKRGGGNTAIANITTASKAATIQTIPVPKSGTSTNNNSTSNINNGKTTNNVTIHVNGANNPNKVAQEVKRQFDLSTALQVASPGFNRPAVA